LEAARGENPNTMILGVSNWPLHVSNKNSEKEHKKEHISTKRNLPLLCWIADFI